MIYGVQIFISISASIKTYYNTKKDFSVVNDDMI